MEAGRKPKPTHLKVVAGNPGHRPLNDQEPQPEIVAPRCPDFLEGPARDEWDAIVPLLVKNRMVSELDYTALACYCQCYQRWEQAEDELKKSTLVIVVNGYPVQNPFLYVANKAMDQMRAFLAEYGLTPASRTRVRVQFAGVKNDPRQNFFDF